MTELIPIQPNYWLQVGLIAPSSLGKKYKDSPKIQNVPKKMAAIVGVSLQHQIFFIYLKGASTKKKIILVVSTFWPLSSECRRCSFFCSKNVGKNFVICNCCNLYIFYVQSWELIILIWNPLWELLIWGFKQIVSFKSRNHALILMSTVQKFPAQ